MKVNEDAWSSRFQEPLVLIKEETTLPTPRVDPQVSRSSSAGQIGSRIGIETILLSNTAKKPRWLTQTLQEAT